jgi:hypothetical protein
MIAIENEDIIVFVEDVNYFKIEPICGTRKYTIRINFGKYNKTTITIGRFSSKEKAIDGMHKLSERFINKDGIVVIKND